jgi:CRP/FNR family transcriptional regulator, cyclic AMP receptor protein
MSFMKSIKYYNDYKHFRKGDCIFKQGDPGDVMYAVVEGEVEIDVNGAKINVVRSGEVLGEMALIDKKPRSATAIALSDCKVVVIDEQRFNFLLQQTPMFVTQIMKVMSDRIRTMDKE